MVVRKTLTRLQETSSCNRNPGFLGCMALGNGGISIMKGVSEQVRQASLQNNAGIVYPAWGQETALDDLLRFLLSLLVYVHVCDSFFLNMRSNSTSRFHIRYLFCNHSHWILRLSESSFGGTIMFWAVYSRWLQVLSLLSVGCVL